MPKILFFAKGQKFIHLPSFFFRYCHWVPGGFFFEHLICLYFNIHQKDGTSSPYRLFRWHIIRGTQHGETAFLKMMRSLEWMVYLPISPSIKLAVDADLCLGAKLENWGKTSKFGKGRSLSVFFSGWVSCFFFSEKNSWWKNASTSDTVSREYLDQKPFFQASKIEEQVQGTSYHLD